MYEWRIPFDGTTDWMANFRNQPVSISVIADGFEPANSDKKYDLKEKNHPYGFQRRL